MSRELAPAEAVFDYTAHPTRISVLNSLVGKQGALFEAQDEIDSKREILITEIEGKLQRRENLQSLFALRLKII